VHTVIRGIHLAWPAAYRAAENICETN